MYQVNIGLPSEAHTRKCYFPLLP